MEGNWTPIVGTENKYQYNGKELNDEGDLNWVDYGARWYDPAVGKWNAVDPLADHPSQIDKSPYAYVWNNPVKLTDPDGRLPILPAVAVVWAAVEVGLAVYDAYDVATTVTDPNASFGEKAWSVGGATLGALLPGGGYSAADDIVEGVVKHGDEVVDEGNKVFRALRADENPADGLRARSPGADTPIGSHVMGKKQSSKISTTKDKSKATGLFNSGNGVVEIDLNKVTGQIGDVSEGYGKGRVYARTKGHKEVLIDDKGGADPPIPSNAIQWVEKPNN